MFRNYVNISSIRSVVTHTNRSISQYVPSGLVKIFSENLNGPDDKYRSKLDIDSCYKLISTKMVFKNALMADGHDVDNVKVNVGKIEEYLKSNVICGREETISKLQYFQSHLVLITGGFSVGKTKVMKQFVESERLKNKSVVMVNGRVAGKKTMDEMIIQSLSNYRSADEKLKVFYEKIKGVLAAMGDVNQRTRLTTSGRIVASLSGLVSAVTKEYQQKHDDTTITKLQVLLDAATAVPEAPMKVLIVDEANHFFYPNEAKEFLETGKISPEWKLKREEILETLKLFVSYTKEQRDLSVVLATSDSSFPYALNKIGFKPKFFVHMIVGEPSPAAALKTVKDWGVGDNLACALVDVFGGHLAQISDQLLKMKGKKSSGFWEKAVHFDSFDTLSLQSCLMEALAHTDTQLLTVVLRTLRTLAEDGFAPTTIKPADVQMANNSVLRSEPTKGDGGQSVSSGLPWLNKIKIRLAHGLQLVPEDAKALADKKSAMDKVRQLAKEKEREEAMMELLTRHNIADFVGVDAIGDHLPDRDQDGLVPATQWVRMLLVRELGQQWMAQDQNVH